MIDRVDLEDSIKFDVLVNWLLVSLKKGYVSTDDLKQLLIALGVEIKKEGNENE